jgi:predicted RNase H-like HicB family nuclease
MEIPILIENLDGNGYRARAGEPFSLSAEGATTEEARVRLKQAIAERLASGALQLSTINLPGPPPEKHSAHLFAGWLPDDELTREWLAIMAEKRREADQDENYY